MDVVRFGLGVRALRRRRRWTQQRLASAVGVSPSAISRMERGRADRVTVRTLIRVAGALDARVDVRLLWHGEGLDRLTDARHADLVERAIAILEASRWEAVAEVTFDLRGQRGSIDVLGFHPGTGVLLVVEVKSVVPDMQAMLAGLDRKTRLGPEIAHPRGWTAVQASRILVLPDDRTSRRRVEAHAATFRSSLPARTAGMRRWIKHPAGVIGGILFLPSDPEALTRHRMSDVTRRDRA